MGTQMTKELGLYNEEEKVCTPLGPQRYRLLNNDPRSPSFNISRTPILVETTPYSKVIKQDVQNAESSFIEDKTEAEDASIPKEEMTSVSDLSEPTESVSAGSGGYLETDIDKCDSPASPAKESVPTIRLWSDVTPTLEVGRTPKLVECTPELFALHSHIDSLSFCDLDIHNDDPSVIVSDDDQTSQHNQSIINNWLVQVEEKQTNSPCNHSFADSPKTVAKKQKELNALKKQLFFTPDAKLIADNVKPKTRTPLGNLQAGQLQESPQQMMRAKQWRNMKEERQRRGIQDSENTPPSLPPLPMVSSAPGKMASRKNKALWDENNTLLI